MKTETRKQNIIDIYYIKKKKKRKRSVDGPNPKKKTGDSYFNYSKPVLYFCCHQNYDAILAT